MEAESSLQVANKFFEASWAIKDIKTETKYDVFVVILSKTILRVSYHKRTLKENVRFMLRVPADGIIVQATI